MALSISLAATLFFTFFLISASAGARSGGAGQRANESVRPSWRVDLRPSVGSAPVRAIDDLRRESVFKAASSLWFTDDNTIVATFVIRDAHDKPQLSSRASSDTRAGPLRLRAILLDAHTGKITATAAWPTNSRMSRIVAVHHGKMIALRGTELTLYSPDLVALKELKLPKTGPGIEWQPHPSPTGNNILLSSNTFGKSSLIWVDIDRFEVVGSWEDNLSGFLTMSDKYIATSTCWSGYQVGSVSYNDSGGQIVSPGPKCNSEINIRTLSSDWKTIAPGESHLYSQFVNQGMLFLGDKTSGKIIGVDGKLLFEQPKIRQSWGCWSTSLLPVPDGHRFVIPSCELRGAFPALDIGGHLVLKQIAVYDVGDKVRWHRIDVEGPRIKDQMEFALSPDGLQLAVLNNETVEVFQLPPSS